jgi:hypothetical protein
MKVDDGYWKGATFTAAHFSLLHRVCFLCCCRLSISCSRTKENKTHTRHTIQVDDGYWKGATFTFSFKVPKNYPYEAPKGEL